MTSKQRHTNVDAMSQYCFKGVCLLGKNRIQFLSRTFQDPCVHGSKVGNENKLVGKSNNAPPTFLEEL